MKDSVGSVQSVLVLGGGSEIALACAEALARRRARTILLAARKPETLEPAADRLRAAGAQRVEILAFDATDFDSHDAFVADAWARSGDIDLVILAFGLLGDAEAALTDRRAALDLALTNYAGAVSVAVPVTARLLAQGHGQWVVLSSVAGERVRKSNLTYGSTKAGLDGYFQGLGDHLHGTGVDVMVVRPGFVRTAMTAGIAPPPLSTTPEAVARDVVRGLERGKAVVWSPAAFRPVMTILRHLPRPIFRRLPF
jgi:decaprenylphospho-beta-D-erythro-pentofuranosid-2-ulose 2-reductase